MNKETKSIKLIELVPYGSFPVSRLSDSRSIDMQMMSSTRELDSDRATYWFDLEETEVA